MKQRHIRQQDQTELIQMLAGALDFECNIIQPYQLRLTKDEKVLDYFPQRGKATWVGTNKWFKIDNIENFLETNFK